MQFQSPSERPQLPDSFWIGEWRVHVSTNRLSRHGQTVKLEPRTMKVLVHLAQQADEAVTRTKLENDVWRGTVVGYDALNNSIAKLRKAFGDDPHNPKFIETLPKVGYRLIAPVADFSADSEAPVGFDHSGPDTRNTALVARRGASFNRVFAAAIVAVMVSVFALTTWIASWDRQDNQRALAERSPSFPEKPSIVVLPFANRSNDLTQEYFSDGITDDIITDLSKISGLFVIARNSSFAYKGKSSDVREISRELGVRYVLQGSARKAGNRIRINVQLADATTGGHIWAERYDGALEEVFKFQDGVATKIVDAVKIRMTDHEQAMASRFDTNDVAAYDAFLKGWAYQLRKSPKDAAQAIVFFKHALELDPEYGRAYAALAQTYWENSVSPEFNVLVGPRMSVSSHTGYTSYVDSWTYLRKAQSKSSSQAHALSARMLQRQRRFDEAMQEARKAVDVGPNDPSAYDALIELLIYSGRTEEAIQLIDESIRIDPRLPGEKLFLKGMAYYVSKRLHQAHSELSRARSHNPLQTRYAAIHAATLAELGRAQEAKVALEEYLSGWTTNTTLNWIMFNWPFQTLGTAERLADDLLKAGLPIPLERYYRVTNDDRLTGNQIKSLISNKTMIVVDQSYYGGGEFEINRGDDAQIIDHGYLTYFRDGTTRIQDDLLCDPWHDLGDYCVAVFRNPDGSREARNEYLFFTFMSTFSFSMFELEN